jgi:hypothetical protein
MPKYKDKTYYIVCRRGCKGTGRLFILWHYERRFYFQANADPRSSCNSVAYYTLKDIDVLKELDLEALVDA